MLGRLLAWVNERLDRWLADMSDVEEPDDTPPCWICERSSGMRDVFGMRWCLPCWDDLNEVTRPGRRAR